MLAVDVLFVQLISYLGISAATSVSNLRQVVSLHRTPQSLFYFIPRVSERETWKFTRFLSSLIRRVRPLSLFSRPLLPVAYSCVHFREKPSQHRFLRACCV